MSLQSKLHLLFLAPVSLVSGLNGLALFIAESYFLLSINILVFVLIVTITLPILGSFSDRLEKNLKDLSVDVETVRYSAGILSNESIEISTDEIEEIYTDLKHVMVSCCHNAEKAGIESKGYLTIAKDLGRICGEMGPLTMRLQELKTHNENLTFFTSDCIHRKSKKMDDQILAMGIRPVKKLTKKVNKPSLRRALAFRSLAQE